MGASRQAGRAHGRLNNYAEEVRVYPDFDGKKSNWKGYNDFQISFLFLVANKITGEETEECF